MKGDAIMSLGGMELILLLAFGGGRNDLVDFIDAPAYFQSRNIAVTVDKMTELAVQDPIDGKTQIRQLLALRWLEEHPAEVKKSKEFQAIQKQIEEVAQGKKAQDLQGFAAEFAKRTLTAWEGKGGAPTVGVPEDSTRKEGLAWFPKSATLVGGFDVRTPSPEGGKTFLAMRNQLFGMVPPQVMEQMYDKLEELGNVRVDRISFAYQEEANDDMSRIYLRLSGKGDHKRLTDFIRNNAPNMTIDEKKVFRGRKITAIHSQNSPPAMVLIGDEDFLMAGFQRSFDVDHKKVAEEMLDIRDGKAESVLAGPLNKWLTTLSPKASGVLVGDLPREMQRGFDPNMIRVFPKTVIVQLLPKDKLIQLSLQAPLDNAKDAKDFAEDVETQKKKGIEALKNPPPLPPGFPLPDKFYDKLTDSLKSLKTEARGNTASLEMSIPPELASPSMMTVPFLLGAGASSKKKGVPVPPPPPQEEKKQSRLDFTPANVPFHMVPPLTPGHEIVMCWHERQQAPGAPIPA
jgi:hypothetical protein